MAKPKNNKKSDKPGSIIQPIIRVNGEKHVLETLFEGEPENMPEIKSIGYAQLKGGNNWVSYVMTTKGREVLSIEVSEPDMRAIAEESSKINFVNCFMNPEL